MTDETLPEAPAAPAAEHAPAAPDAQAAAAAPAQAPSELDKELDAFMADKPVSLIADPAKPGVHQFRRGMPAGAAHDQHSRSRR